MSNTNKKKKKKLAITSDTVKIISLTAVPQAGAVMSAGLSLTNYGIGLVVVRTCVRKSNVILSSMRIHVKEYYSWRWR